MDTGQTQRLIDGLWDDSIVPQLIDYIRIPNKSPLFDPDWQAHGYMEQAIELLVAWCRVQAVAGLELEIIRLAGRTPLIYIEIPGQGDSSVLLYGHLDKQPEMTGWRAGLGPWQPQLDGERLYGRGGADDGYAIFSSLAAVLALQAQGVPHANLKIMIEASEESGSPDLPAYMAALADRLGQPDLVVCLDSGCGNYEQLWCTTSLRGVVAGTLRVAVLTEGVHSGDASGVVPSSWRILRRLLERVEDAASGRVLPATCHADIPPLRRDQAGAAAAVLGDTVHTRFPFVASMQPADTDHETLILNRTWRPALEITGADGLPAISDAGNVLRPTTTAKLSFRLPPTTDAAAVSKALRALLESDPPYRATVQFTADQASRGWHAPAESPWLAQSVQRASQAFFAKPAMYMGEGGTIPFMAMLGEQFPAAEFLITGVLGPHSNAHGPNEFLHIPTGKRVTACVAQIIADHSRAKNGEAMRPAPKIPLEI